MDNRDICLWLLDKAARAQDHAHARVLNLTAKRLKELATENAELKQRLFVLEELDQPKETAHWIIHTSKDDIWAECSNCLTCGSPRWNVCPVCERKMVDDNGKT